MGPIDWLTVWRLLLQALRAGLREPTGQTSECGRAATQRFIYPIFGVSSLGLARIRYDARRTCSSSECDVRRDPAKRVTTIAKRVKIERQLRRGYISGLEDWPSGIWRLIWG